MPRDKDLIEKRNAFIRAEFDRLSGEGYRSGWIYEKIGTSDEYRLYIRPDTVAEIVSGRVRGPKKPKKIPGQTELFVEPETVN